MMETKLPVVEVAVAWIKHGERVLTVYNASWGGFSFPMTKRREWVDSLTPTGVGKELWEDAAARAYAECLGRTCVPKFLLETKLVQRSDREGNYKHYHFQVFQVEINEEIPLPGTLAEWLELDDFNQRRPISPTTLALIDELRRGGVLPS